MRSLFRKIRILKAELACDYDSVIALIKNIYRMCILVFGCFISTSAFSENNIFDPVSPGFSFGLNYGNAYTDHSNSRSKFNNVSGLFFTASAYAEKPISDIFSLSAELHVSSLAEVGNSGSSSTGALVSLGSVIGRLEKTKSPYIATSIGYSYVDIGSAGQIRSLDDDGSCFAFAPCFGPGPFRKGGHGKGLGYRIAVGLVTVIGTRLELAYMNLGGAANGLPKGSIASMETMNLGIHVQF